MFDHSFPAPTPVFPIPVQPAFANIAADTDLAFAVRAACKRVLYQPASRVLHLEGITSGTDLNTGPKAYQVRNRSVFEQKWRSTLAKHPKPDVTPSPALLHARQRQILVVDEALPQADRD